jgi:hypothetical protein
MGHDENAQKRRECHVTSGKVYAQACQALNSGRKELHCCFLGPKVLQYPTAQVRDDVAARTSSCHGTWHGSLAKLIYIRSIAFFRVSALSIYEELTGVKYRLDDLHTVRTYMYAVPGSKQQNCRDYNTPASAADQVPACGTWRSFGLGQLYS